MTALQDYTEVLSRHFPGRDSTKNFLHELFQWVIGHSDAVRGEDLIGNLSNFVDNVFVKNDDTD